MKRRSRTPIVVLVLAVIAVVFTCRSFARHGIVVFSIDDFWTSTDPQLNNTIFRVAAVDDSAAELRTEVDDLQSGSLDTINHGNFRYITLWKRNSQRARPATRLRISAERLQRIASEPSELFRKFQQLLKDWFRNHGLLQPAVMSDIVKTIKDPIDSHHGVNNTSSSTQRYSSCAVVGNSGILLQSNHGEVIDSHDVVIRLNNARVGGYGSHVGTKTSVSFINSNVLHNCAIRDGCSCHPYGDGVPIVFYICQPAHFLEYMVCKSSHAAPLLVTDARFDALCARLVKYYSVKTFVEETGKQPTLWGKFHDEKMFHYSSGMQAIMMAVGMCDRVSVFGFGKSTNAKHHYHTNQKSELGLHDYEAEYELYRDLAERPEVVPFLNDAGIKVPPVTFYY